MLKRNGEDCEYEVPNFPGLLTAREHKAYQAILPLVIGEIREFNEFSQALTDFQRQIPQVVNEVTKSPIENAGYWQSRRDLIEVGNTRVWLGSYAHGENEKEIFGVLETLYDPFIYDYESFGETFEIVSDTELSLTLHGYVKHKQSKLETTRAEIRESVENALAEKFPGEDFSRVTMAMSARCVSQTPVEQNASSEKQVASIYPTLTWRR
jgi:hypothetical protein